MYSSIDFFRIKKNVSNIPKLSQVYPDIWFDIEEILKLQFNINPVKAAGQGNIRARVLTEISSKIAPYFHQFNQSYRSCSVSTSWTHT